MKTILFHEYFGTVRNSDKCPLSVEIILYKWHEEGSSSDGDDYIQEIRTKGFAEDRSEKIILERTQGASKEAKMIRESIADFDMRKTTLQAEAHRL